MPYNEANVFFWMNIRETGGYRLTKQGDNFLTETLVLESSTTKLENINANSKFLLELDKFLDFPYYVETGRWPKIKMYDMKAAMWLTFHDDNFSGFMNAFKKPNTH